jgi:transposase-like protein
MNHCSTIEERIHMISQIIAQPTHGLLSQLSRTNQVSRQTLYRWSAIGRKALQEALGTTVVPMKRTPSLPILVLTLLIETHASYRGIQSTLRRLHGIKVSLGTITGIVKEAGQRAQDWMKQQQAGTARALALDEQYSSQRGKAYQSAD